MNNCKHCKEEIPINSRQYPGFHMWCAEEELTLFKTGPMHNNKIVADQYELINYLKDLEKDETWTVEVIKMSRIQYENLPESSGF